jgi:hypothetical protein
MESKCLIDNTNFIKIKNHFNHFGKQNNVTTFLAPPQCTFTLSIGYSNGQVVSPIYLAKPKCNVYLRAIISSYKFLRERKKCHPKVVLNIILVLQCIQSFGRNIITLCMFLLNFIER